MAPVHAFYQYKAKTILYKRLFIRVLFPIESNTQVENVRMRGLTPSVTVPD